MKRLIPIALCVSLAACTYTGPGWINSDLTQVDQNGYGLYVKQKPVRGKVYDLQVNTADFSVITSTDYHAAQLLAAQAKMQETCPNTYTEQTRVFQKQLLEIRFQCS